MATPRTYLVHPEVYEVLYALYEVDDPLAVVVAQVPRAEEALGVEQLTYSKEGGGGKKREEKLVN